MTTTVAKLSEKELQICKEMIQAYPLFDDLSDQVATELAQHFVEQRVNAGDVIVAEDDWLDSVYFIAEGKAEVRRQLDQLVTMPVAILQKNETIGLSSNGFYSMTCKRYATVTALTPMVLFRIGLDELDHFLMTHPPLAQRLREKGQLMLRVNFIKCTLPFAGLSPQALWRLAHEVTEVTIPANTLVFKQDDEANDCYLLRFGTVEVFSQEGDNPPKQLAILSAPSIFGEVGVLTKNKRNASIVTLETCHLLKISGHLLREVVKDDLAAAQALTGLVAARTGGKASNDKEFTMTKDGWIVFH